MRLLTWLRHDLSSPAHRITRTEFWWSTSGVFANATVVAITDRGSATNLALIGVALAAFCLRGPFPRLPVELFAALVIIPVWLVTSQPGVPLEGAIFLSVIMVLSVAVNSRSLVRATIVMSIGAVYPFLVSTRQTGFDDIGWIAWSAAHVLTFVIGRVMRRLIDVIGELEAARAALAEQAVAEERRRIARDLHDLAGHTLAAVLLHVTGARHVLRRDPDEAERALVEAEMVGRRSLDQVRATVSALRTTESGTDAALVGGAELPQLLGEYRSAGLKIIEGLDSRTAMVDGPAGVALHRITREALANVARHAPANQVHVAIDIRADMLHLTVEDHGSAPTEPPKGPTHFGLIGMQERARALGGELIAGPTVDGWSVTAQLPLPQATLERR